MPEAAFRRHRVTSARETSTGRFYSSRLHLPLHFASRADQREEYTVRNRRSFLKHAAGTTAGLFIARSGFSFTRPQIGAAAGKRREVVIGGRRVQHLGIPPETFRAGGW